MKWTRLDETKLDNIGGTYHKAVRVYGLNGELWPRMTIKIFHHHDGLNIIASIKNNEHAWWTDCGIPEALIGDVVEMLQNLKPQ